MKDMTTYTYNYVFIKISNQKKGTVIQQFWPLHFQANTRDVNSSFISRCPPNAIMIRNFLAFMGKQSRSGFFLSF